uniref:Uncharacterized protein n=1 Tax=Arundo donax TaxID=35708 RepID=A0A0A9DP59_ARUDO
MREYCCASIPTHLWPEAGSFSGAQHDGPLCASHRRMSTN